MQTFQRNQQVIHSADKNVYWFIRTIDKRMSIVADCDGKQYKVWTLNLSGKKLLD